AVLAGQLACDAVAEPASPHYPRGARHRNARRDPGDCPAAYEWRASRGGGRRARRVEGPSMGCGGGRIFLGGGRGNFCYLGTGAGGAKTLAAGTPQGRAPALPEIRLDSETGEGARACARSERVAPPG